MIVGGNKEKKYMKFRIYQLFYVAAVALLIAALCMPVTQFIEASGATALMTNFSLQQPDGSSSYVVCALGVVLIFAALVNVFGLLISFFQNFELQKRVAILSVLLLTGYYLLLLIFSLLLIEGVSLSLMVAAIFPLIALVLNVMSFLSTRRTEAKILASASGFRLRD